jgi:hypothetical protein
MSIVNPPKHPNIFEHTEALPRFMLLFVLYGTLGGVLGRITDKAAASIKPQTRINKALVFLLQLLINSATFYFAFHSIKIQKLAVDDWVSGTFQGIIFITTFYTVQEELLANLKGALL